MDRFFLHENQIVDGTVTFPDDISRQIRKVLRMDMKKGAVIVLDNSGWEYLVQLDGLKGNQVVGHIMSKQEGRSESNAHITVCFSQARREKVEMILQKCTEIGVSEFIPFVSSRTLVKGLKENSARQDRLTAIIREASEQCRRSRLPELHPAVSFEDLLKQTADREIRLIAWEGTPLVRQICPQMLSPLSEMADKSVALLIGPEGGFSAEEVSLAEEFGYQQVSLGVNILRMETACIAGSALLRHFCDGSR
ncbi:MAG: 16S rRNA (uracil(1498)-N(3))-methyltransferase [Chloroflexi bacterium]|jgi:16S rRNA (uracil1498-N3)-methyltransferase|nr:16S rRNA (uracil(1498)-N(3))-methyltransferase [Chloroflexota bacterium]